MRPYKNLSEDEKLVMKSRLKRRTKLGNCQICLKESIQFVVNGFSLLSTNQMEA